MNHITHTIGFHVNDLTDNVKSQLTALRDVCKIENISHLAIVCLENGYRSIKLLIFGIDDDQIKNLLERVNRSERIKAVLQNTTMIHPDVSLFMY
jgi:hypothetical protein